MGVLIQALINFLSNNFSASKLLLTTLFIVVLPVLFWNVWVEITEFVLSLLQSQLASVSLPSSFSFSFGSLGSFAAWLASSLYIPEAFAMLVSSLSVRIITDLILKLLTR